MKLNLYVYVSGFNNSVGSVEPDHPITTIITATAMQNRGAPSPPEMNTATIGGDSAAAMTAGADVINPNSNRPATSGSTHHRKAWQDTQRTKDEEKRALCQDTDPPASSELSATPQRKTTSDAAISRNEAPHSATSCSSPGGGGGDTQALINTTSSANFVAAAAVDSTPPNVPIMPPGKTKESSRPTSGGSSAKSNRSRKSAWDNNQDSAEKPRKSSGGGKRGKRRKGSGGKNGESKPVELQEVNGQLYDRDVEAENGGTAAIGGDATTMSCMGSIKGFSKLFKSKKFKSPHLEQLYQRYFFSLNKSSFNNLMVLLACLLVVMIVVHYSAGQTTPYKGAFLGVFVVSFLAMFAFCSRNSCSHKHLVLMSYIVIAMLAVTISIDVLDSYPSSATNGVWTTLFFIYMVYTLLPIRMRMSVLSGGLLMGTHVICAASKNRGDIDFLWKQVSS